MEKVDNLFLRVINDERLVDEFDIEPSKYSCLEDGRKSQHPQVHAIAEIIAQMSIKINDAKGEMRIRYIRKLSCYYRKKKFYDYKEANHSQFPKLFRQKRVCLF
jgi:hypothetical protein